MFIPPDLVNEKFDDRYFDVVNALDEAQQIHFGHSHLIERLTEACRADHAFHIGETGFGAGRLVVALMECLNQSQLKNLRIAYHTVELYPMSAQRMDTLLSGFKHRAGVCIDTLLEAYANVAIQMPGLHRMKLQQAFGSIDLYLWIGEALEMVRSLQAPCDAWFLDGHSPKKNPSIWRPELLAAVGEKTLSGGTCSTFTVAVAVKKALMDAGFSVHKLPGFGGKKEVLQGIKI